MTPSDLLVQAISGNQVAAQELGRLLDSLTPWMGEGQSANHQRRGLVFLANDGEIGSDAAVRADDIRIRWGLSQPSPAELMERLIMESNS